MTEDMGNFEGLVFALVDGLDWQQVPWSEWKAYRDGAALTNLRGCVRIVLLVIENGAAVNAIPHFLDLGDDGSAQTSLSLSPDEFDRMSDLWPSEKPADVQEYNRLAEKGYRAALPDSIAIARLVKTLPVPINAIGGITSFLAAGGMDATRFSGEHTIN